MGGAYAPTNPYATRIILGSAAMIIIGAYALFLALFLGVRKILFLISPSASPAGWQIT
jgi:hypothetical protein